MRGEENEKEEAPLAQQSTPMDGRGRVSCEASPPRAVRGDEGNADPEEAASLGPMQLDGEEGEEAESPPTEPMNIDRGEHERSLYSGKP